MPDDKTKSLLAPIVIYSDEFWQGFRDRELPSYTITTMEKKQFLQYPELRGVIRVLGLPNLAARVDLDGDEQQKDFLREWFGRYYRRITKIVMQKAMSWGFCAGEKIYEVVEMNGKKRLIVKSVFAPEPYNVDLSFSKEPLALKAFRYADVTIEKEKMMYYVYQGDEISNPKGTSVVDDVAWAMDMLLKDWTMWQVYKKFKAIAFLKMFYPIETKTVDGKQVDVNRQKALDLIEKAKEAAGMAFGRKQNADGSYTSGWDVNEIAFGTEKTSAFIDGINKEESLIFVGSLVPRNILEQLMEVGSYARLKGEINFFIQYVLSSNLEDYEEHLRDWVVNPMLQDNFGSVKAAFNLKLGDEMVGLFVEIIKEGIRMGMCNPDYDEMMDSSGMPRKKDVPETTVETERKATGHVHFQGKRQIRKDLHEQEQAWIDTINPQIEKIKMRLYSEMEDRLTKQRGKVGLLIAKVFDQQKITVQDLKRVVQIPRSIFTGTIGYLIQAWEVGMNAVMSKAKDNPLDKPNLIALRKLQVGWEGIGAPNEIAGQGELLETRLFQAVLGLTDKLEAMRVVDIEFENYIKKIVPQRLNDLVHNSAIRGILDANEELNIRKFKNMAGGK